MKKNIGEMVQEFHVKYGFSVNKNLLDEGSKIVFDSRDLEYTAERIEILVRTIKHAANAGRIGGDDRLYRMYLILGEALEVCRALDVRDEIELADGITDLNYVTTGTGVTYGLPIMALFKEVHKSNMTKELSDTRDDETRDVKTNSFIPPNIEGILNADH